MPPGSLVVLRRYATIRGPRVLLAWLAGLGLAQAGGMVLLWRAAADVRERAADLSAAGLFAPPAGAAVGDLMAPAGIALAALAYTASLGLGACLTAQLGADCLGHCRRPFRWIPALLIMAAAGLVGWFDEAPLLALWLAGLYLVPWGILITRGPTDAAGVRRTAGIWSGVLLLLLPAAFTIEPEDLRRSRNGMLSLDGGQALVNTYYRHALLAAEPIKAPGQRQYLTWSPADATPPSWFRCMREPWVLLPLGTGGQADIGLRSASMDGVTLVDPRGHGREKYRANRHDIGDRITALLQPTDRSGFRTLVAVAFLLGAPGTIAWAVACPVSRRCGPWPTPVICAAIGGALILLLPGGDAETRVRIDGTGVERMRAAAAGMAEPAVLRRLADGDELLPVRARALAAWVRRTPDPSAAAGRVADAGTWYEQWYGYHALIRQGWHPDTDRCR